MTNIPDGYYFTKQHEWAKEENGSLVIGISDFAQHSLGDIVFVDIQAEGTQLGAGDSLGTIESVKAAEDIYTPAGGIIQEINTTLADSPESINSDPYGSWLVKLKDFNNDDLKNLMDSAAYREYVASLDD